MNELDYVLDDTEDLLNVLERVSWCVDPEELSAAFRREDFRGMLINLLFFTHEIKTIVAAAHKAGFDVVGEGNKPAGGAKGSGELTRIVKFTPREVSYE